VRVAGTDRLVAFADLARRSAARQRTLSAEDAFMPEEATYPNGTHLAEVEIDPDTGATRIVSYWVVDDFGATLKSVAAGRPGARRHGAGHGQALMENALYDASSGQLVSASLMDYALPRAADIPPLAFETCNVPVPDQSLGGEGGGGGGPPSGLARR